MTPEATRPELEVRDAAGALVARVQLGPDPVTLGGEGGPHALPGLDAGALVARGAPARLEAAAGAPDLVVRGEARRAVDLRPGAPVQVGGLTLSLREPEAALTEVAADPPAPAPWLRLKAGLLVETGRADRAAAKRVQDSVVAGEFDPDAAAATLLAAGPVPDDDPALDQRTARLMRDLVMAPAQRGVRGAARSARRTTRGFVAFLVVQGVGIVVYSLVVFATLVFLASRGWSIEPWLHRVLELVPLGG